MTCAMIGPEESTMGTTTEDPTYHSVHIPSSSRSKERLEAMANAVSNNKKGPQDVAKDQSAKSNGHGSSKSNADNSGSSNATSEPSSSQTSASAAAAAASAAAPVPGLVASGTTTTNNRPTSTKEAREHVAEFLSNSHRLGKHIQDYPLFDAQELMIGRWLGRGGFSNVEELRGFNIAPAAIDRDRDSSNLLLDNLSKHSAAADLLKSPIWEEEGEAPQQQDYYPSPDQLGYEDPPESSEESATERHNNESEPFGISNKAMPVLDEGMFRRFLVQNCVRESGEARYAIKRLRPDITDDPKQFPLGAMDLAIEALFLSDLQHPNIIKLRGLSSWDPFLPAKVASDSYYFLVLDRLHDTLWDRIKKWKERKRKMDTVVGRVGDLRGTKRQILLDERLAAAFDLSAALAYLKEQKIIHRDIKPENIGFDIRGDIKIFDFGLARELRDIDKDPINGMYHLSNMTGSLRYMSPEVAKRGTPYNEKVDVYSFTIVLWEMLALQRAFMGVAKTQEKFMHEVFEKNKRPPIRAKWPKNIAKLLQNGWIADPNMRLTAEECHEILRNELVSMRHGDDDGLDHLRRRSTYLVDESSRNFQANWTFQGTQTSATDAAEQLASKLPWAASKRNGIAVRDQSCRAMDQKVVQETDATC